ncbi:MAG: hypothetical protein JKY52_14325 [Flavobacteriales bacterium]|nr:hypothetical protein [Flavobacteriales bacterium]
MKDKAKGALGLLLGCALLCASCGTGPEDIDVSHLELDFKIKRFEQALFQLSTDSVEHQIQELEKEYGEFFTFFAAGSINIGRRDNPSFSTSLMGFVKDAQINDVLSEVNTVFDNVDALEADLKDAFKHYMYYFPGQPVPQIVTYISGFNSSLMATDKALGVGLDMYLGESCKYYQMLTLPQYKIQNMVPEMIVSNCMRGWLTSEMVMDDEHSSLLEQMIYQGKVLYYLDHVIPNEEDRYKIGFTADQLLWCNRNEEEMWKHLVDEKLLYTTDFTKIIKYVGEAPFTVGFPDGSPGRTGWWLGWQIVKAFMENNEALSLAELMQMKDAEYILRNSKYKPNR